jgi:uncharacterized protein YggE
MKTSICLIAISLCLVPHGRAEPEIKGTPAELQRYLPGVAGTVAIAGEGEVKVPADRAVMSFKIVTEHKSLADALRQNEEIRSQIAGFLKSRGLSTDRIQKSKFASTARHGVFTDKVKSQRVENEIKITTLDEKEFQLVASLPDRFTEVIYAGTEFEHSEKEQLRNRAVAQACANAERRKQQYEQALNLKLTPKSFVEHAIHPGPERKPWVQGGSAPSFVGEPVLSSGYPSVGPFAETVSAFGELVFKVQVTVEYTAEKTVKQ